MRESIIGLLILWFAVSITLTMGLVLNVYDDCRKIMSWWIHYCYILWSVLDETVYWLVFWLATENYWENILYGNNIALLILFIDIMLYWYPDHSVDVGTVTIIELS